MRSTTILGVLTMATISTLGGTARAGSGGADPSLPKEVQEMYCLVGEWRGTGTLEAEGQKTAMKISLSCKPTSGGFGIACQSRFVDPAGHAYEETDLFGYDPGARKYHWFAVTSAGETHDHVADLPTGNTITWVYTGRQDTRPLQETVSFVFGADGKRLQFRSTTVVGGATAAVLDGTIAKK